MNLIECNNNNSFMLFQKKNISNTHEAIRDYSPHENHKINGNYN